VSAQTKRRRLSLLTLPIVVTVGFLIVAKLAAWQRSDLIADLADCISHGETRDAIEAVHKLAAIPSPPIPVLVTAAASDEHETAGAAQVAIDRLLRRWQRDVETKQRFGTIASQLSELAQSLSETQSEFSDSDHTWLESTARKILRIANKFPPSKTPLVAVHCDAILTSLGVSRYPATANEAPVSDDPDDVISESTNSNSVAAREFASGHDVDRTNLEHEFSAFEPLSSDGEDAKGQSSGNGTSVENMHPASAPPAAMESWFRSDEDTAEDTPDNLPVNDLRYSGGGSADEESSERLSSRPDILRRSEGAPPIFRILPAMPINVLPNGDGSSKRMTPDSRTASEGDGNASGEALAGVDSRELLRKWLAAENGDVQPIERELAKRRFGKLSKRLVRQYFADNTQDRLKSIDMVLAQPGGGSEAWLLLLSGDSDPDVRLFAVTFMATSNNSALVEKAWQAAIRDRDPRIADLAERLRERRDGPLRR
jgi:hypothetical protein